MSFFGMENFAFADVSAVFNDTQTTLSLAVGDTDRFTEFPALATLTNITDYPNTHEAFAAGDAEIIEIDSKSGDTFNTIKRAQDGTVGISTTPGKNYRVAVIATKSQWDKVCRAHPDASGPFDAILEGVPGAVTDAVARFVLSNTLRDCVLSIQGSNTNTRSTALRMGPMSDPGLFRLNLQKLTSVTDEVGVLLNTIEFLTLQGRGRLGIYDETPAQVGGISVGQSMTFKKMIGFKETGATIAAGSITDVIGNIIRVSAEGGPGTDDLDEILLNAADLPANGNRMIIIVEPQTTAHDITIRDKFIGGGNISLQGDSFEFPMFAQGDRIAFISDGIDNDEWVEIWRTRKADYVVIRDEKAQNVSGGTFTSGSWQTRDLQTTQADSDALVSLAANQFTLQPGRWEVNISAPAYQVARHQTRLQNITDGTTTLLGTSERANSAHFVSRRSYIVGFIFIGAATPKTFEVQHQCSLTRATDGFGVAANLANEVYTQCQFRRLETG